MKRLLAILVIVALAAACGLLAMWNTLASGESSELEQWIGRQVVGVLEGYITPRVSFERLKYRPPLGVEVEPLALTVGEEALISVERLLLELAEVPKSGQPIRIKRIELYRPRVSFIRGADGELVGWGDFVKRTAVQSPDSVPEEHRLSEVLVLEHVEIHDGTIAYRAADSEMPPMELPGIDLVLETTPRADDDGWYEVKGRSRHEPLYVLDFDTRLNLDHGELDVERLGIELTLSSASYEIFPPDMQNTLRRHEVRGELSASAKGRVPLAGPQAGKGDIQLDLADAHIRYGGRVFSAEDMKLTVALFGADTPPFGNGRLTITNARLVDLPLVSTIGRALAKAPLPRNLAKATDRASFDFGIHEDRLNATRFELVSTLIAMRGTGSVYYDGGLDLLVNAGMLEMVQSRTSVVGELFGRLTDKLVKYRVTGTVGRPRIGVKPLGL